MSKITVENWKEHLTEMEKSGPGKCWDCNAVVKDIYHYDTAIFYKCEACGHEICIDFSNLMPMFGVSLADEWRAEERAADTK